MIKSIDYHARSINLVQFSQQYYTIEKDNPNGLFSKNRKTDVRAVRRLIVPFRTPISMNRIRACLVHQIPVLVDFLLNAILTNRDCVQISETLSRESEFHTCLVIGYDNRIQHFYYSNFMGI
jgi:hypothetical protein